MSPWGKAATAVSAASMIAASLVAGAASASADPATNANGVVQVPALSSQWYGGGVYDYPYNLAGTSSVPDTPDPATVVAATGEKAFTVAFILATDVNDPNGNGDNATNADNSVANGKYWSCAPTWDGNEPLSTLTPYINAIRNAGGDAALSFGGYGGYKLGEICGTPAATAAAMQTAIDYFGVHAIDLDLESPEYADATYTATEIAALKILQTDNPGLYISVTTGATTTGVSPNGQNILADAKADGFTPNNFTIMPFDGGYGFPYFNQGYKSEETALTDFHTDLVHTFGWNPAAAWAHEGFSGMNGRTDQAQSEVFTPNDFAHTVDWAESRHLGRFTFWALQRDFQCPSSQMPWTYSWAPWNCSGVAQAPYAFTKDSVAFAERVRVSTSSASSPASPASPSSPSSTSTRSAS